MRSLPRQHLLSLTLATVFGSASIWSPLAAAQGAGQTSQVFDINVPAQALASALNELSRQTGSQVFAAGDVVSGISSRAVTGQLTSEQALREMLTGSPLQATRTANGGFAIRRVPEQGASATTLPVVTVTDREDSYGPIQGYTAKRSATGAKTDTPIVEIPQSISVVGAEEIDVLKSQNIQDALGYVAGVSRSEGLDRTTDTLIVRGFQIDGNGNQYRDGLKYTVNRYNGQQEPYGLDRIELLKGAASVLYGAASPGGVLNTVSKRPTTAPLHELNMELGSFNRKQVSGDFGGALDKDGEWSYRLTFLKRDSNTFIDHVPDDRFYIAPALKWQPNANTSLTLLTEYQKDKTGYVLGLPESGTILPNINGRIPRNRFVGEPGFDTFEGERYSVGYVFEHAFNDKLKLRHGLRYIHADIRYRSVFVSGLASDQRTSRYRGTLSRWDDSSGLTSDTSLEYQGVTGPVKHTLLAGVDYYAPRHSSERYEGSLGSIDIFNPVYGQPIGNVDIPNPFSWRSKARQLGVYFQDQMKISDKWVVLLGGRHDSVRYDESNFFTGEKSADNEKSSAFTGRAGLVYLADNGLAPFLSYSESFEPTSGRDRLGSRFKPTTGEQVEAGIRFQPKGSNTLISAAVYQLTRQNVLVADPQDPTLSSSIQAGEIRSRGFELEARTSISRHANVIAAYAYTDARTTRASALQPEQQDRRTYGVPRNQLSLWGDYSFGEFGLPGLKVGVGMRYVGSTRSQNYNVVPSFTLLDAMVSYTTGPWRFALNATNLADKNYVGSCSTVCFYGEPRKVIGTATYRW